MVKVFNENKHELWYFSVKRNKNQRLMHYIFKCISKQKSLRSKA